MYVLKSKCDALLLLYKNGYMLTPGKPDPVRVTNLYNVRG